VKITDVKVHAVKGRHWPRVPMVFVEVETDVDSHGQLIDPAQALHPALPDGGAVASAQPSGPARKLPTASEVRRARP
jgi:hypothetical protein